MPPIAPALRASIGATRPANGFANFRLPCKKLVFEYCEVWGSAQGMREFIASQKAGPSRIASENPSVEVIVKKRPFKHPIIRGLYLNNRDKVICVRNLGSTEIAQKVRLLLDSSGDKLKLEKGHPVKSTTESVRGIYSPFHTPWQGADNMGKIR